MGWDKNVREICRAHNIIYQGFSLLTANTGLLVDPAIDSLARRLHATTMQVIFAFALSIGMLPLTGTTNAKHMKDDLQAEQISLLPEDIQMLESMGQS
jgi:diketogulonate reductase-like aldo/keto reductase